MGPYKRVLLKLSGEVLMGPESHGLHHPTISRICKEILTVRDMGIEVAVVVGGGNIFRGISGKEKGIERTTADHMGMLATVMNALAVQSTLEDLGVHTRVLSAVPMQSICEPYIRRRAVHHMEKGRVIICAAGTGNPYFTTDTAAVLRASELSCSALLKGTKVNGIYSEDPKKNPHATFYPTLTSQQILTDDLRVMDGAAIALSRDSRIPVIVFSILEEGGFIKAAQGQGQFTIVTHE